LWCLYDPTLTEIKRFESPFPGFWGTSELPLRQTGIALEPKAAVQAEKEVTTFKKYF